MIFFCNIPKNQYSPFPLSLSFLIPFFYVTCASFYFDRFRPIQFLCYLINSLDVAREILFLQKLSTLEIITVDLIWISNFIWFIFKNIVFLDVKRPKYFLQINCVMRVLFSKYVSEKIHIVFTQYFNHTVLKNWNLLLLKLGTLSPCKRKKYLSSPCCCTFEATPRRIKKYCGNNFYFLLQ